jgi:hypothetical protein
MKMTIESIESRLKRKLPSKEELRKAQQKAFEKHEPEAIVRYKIIHHPYGIRKPLDARDWAHICLTQEAQAIIKASKREDVRKQMQRIAEKRMQAEQQRRLEKEKEAQARRGILNDPLFQLTRAFKHMKIPQFIEDFEGKFDKETQKQACLEFSKAVTKRALNPPLTAEQTAFGLAYCRMRLAQLEASEEQPQSLLRKVISTFRGH